MVALTKLRASPSHRHQSRWLDLHLHQSRRALQSIEAKQGAWPQLMFLNAGDISRRQQGLPSQKSKHASDAQVRNFCCSRKEIREFVLTWKVVKVQEGELLVPGVNIRVITAHEGSQVPSTLRHAAMTTLVSLKRKGKEREARGRTVSSAWLLVLSFGSYS